MNYFNALPCEIVDYIYELRHKSMLNDVNNDINQSQLLKIDNYYKEIKIDMTIIVDGRSRKFKFDSFNSWNYRIRDNDIINIYYRIDGDLKVKFLDFALLNKIPIYKSWNKGKMINYLFKNNLIDDYIIYSRPNLMLFL